MSAARQPGGHLAIMASAGSGKTQRLTDRYLQLLAAPGGAVAPGRICALTFTRKAAGEMFERIVGDLCAGASSPAGAASVAGRLGLPGMGPSEFARLLRLFLDQLHRAVIGTMDSFVVGVARAFPIELGIPLEFQVAEAEEAEGQALRRDILAGLLADPDGGRGGAGFLDAFRQATFGVEEKTLESQLDNMVRAFHLAYRFCPRRECWGRAERIWPGRRAAAPACAAAAAAAAKTVTEWILEARRAAAADTRLLDALAAIVEAMAGFDPGASWPKALSGPVFDQILGGRDALRGSGARLTYYRRDLRVPGAVGRALAALADRLIATEMGGALEKTQGLFSLLEHYDRAYHRAARESGRFSFTDIQCLLAPDLAAGSGLSLSRERQAGRLFIDYRLDNRLDHWLLDEFQDTSDLQWSIFGNLVAELIQADPSGRTRSFFYVGDIKQSIYRWRGGNPALFLGVLDRFNRSGPVIETESLSASYRCSPPVVEAVNAVFSRLPGELPAGAVETWRAVWNDHAAVAADAPGCAALLEAEALPDDDPESARYRLVAALLNEIQPVRRGLSVGVLTRDNDACSELVNRLRRECPGMPVAHEGKAGILENELAQVLLSLVRLAAHPGDRFAWQHLRMSPLAPALDGLGAGCGEWPLRLLETIESSGFLGFFGEWGGRLARAQSLNAYGRQCLARLEQAAAEFDAAGSRSCNRFLRFVADCAAPESAGRGAVRIMTIHQAKGLGFDLVILPQLQHRTQMNMLRAETPDLLCGGATFAPDWILRPPRRAAAEADPVLAGRLRALDERHAFDWLCLLYVAMTRARHALYLVVSPEGKSGVFRPATLLKRQLAGAAGAGEARLGLRGTACALEYQAPSGSASWYQSFPLAPSAGPAPEPEAQGGRLAERPSQRRPLERAEPSDLVRMPRPAAALFEAETRDVLDFGALIHGLFERIEWLDPDGDPLAEAEAVAAEWRPPRGCDPFVRDDAWAQFRACLQAGDVRAALARPGGDAVLWRERRFDVILDGRWVSGVFDRAVIRRDAAGRPVSGALLDYKSDRHLEAGEAARRQAERHRPQMELYRRALSVLLGVAADRIAMDLLFTVPACVVRLQGAGSGRGSVSAV